MSIGFVELLHLLNLESSVVRHFMQGLGLVAFAMPLVLTRAAINRSFRKETKTTLLGTILTSYMCLLLVFGALYYALAAMGQLRNLSDEFDYYLAQREKLESGEIDEALRRGATAVELNGISTQIIVGLRDAMPEHVSPEAVEPPISYYLEAARGDKRDIIRFVPSRRLLLLEECLHFSVVTQTTLGYGNISPNTTESRLATTMQVLTALLLSALGLGMLFANWWEAEDAADGLAEDAIEADPAMADGQREPTGPSDFEVSSSKSREDPG